MESAVQNVKNLNAEVFCGRHHFAEFWQHIQILVVEPFDDCAIYKRIEISKVANHASFRVDRADDGDLNEIVVPVSVNIVALAVSLDVSLRRHCAAMQTVRSRKPITSGQMGSHASP